MIEPYTKEIEAQMQELHNRLSEKNKRLYAGVEALKLSYGGVSYIARLFDCSRDTILRGIKELNEEETLDQNRDRKAGGGRKQVLEKHLDNFEPTNFEPTEETNEEKTPTSKHDRKAEDGQKPVFEKHLNIDEVFLILLKEHTAGDPMDEKVKWTNLTCAEIASLLKKEGFKVSRNIVRKLLKKHGYVKRKALKKNLLKKV